MKRNIVTISLLIFLASCQGTTENVETGNDLYSKSFSFRPGKASRIEVQIKSNTPDRILSASSDAPYFEFVVNNKLVTSGDRLWEFKNHTERSMGNGGTEHTLVFDGVKKPVRGLQVVLKQQTFPGSTLMREKLELHSAGASFQLNKADGRLHFRFPAYAIDKSANLPARLTEIRMATWEKRPVTFGDRQKGNHMFYPDILQKELVGGKQVAKGPVSIVSSGAISWFTAYEHASQDNLNGLLKKEKIGTGNMVTDAMQDVKGIFNFPISDHDFLFLGVTTDATGPKISVAVDMFRGGYLDGEIIDPAHPYSTVWTATGFYEGDDPEKGKAMLRDYLFNLICEKPASREPEFYYNTWGMQRNDRTKPLRGILTYDRIFEEIEYAAELGVDIFVLDDGWQVTQGIWSPNEERLPQGLAPIRERLERHGIKLGLWYSPMGIDSTTQRYRDHLNWVIKDSEGKPIMAQWNHPAFDFVSGFFDLFVDDCKKMIDQGCRFMKWDAINTFFSTLPDLDHGSSDYPPEEIRARYDYLLPIYVTRAMEILTDYEPELIIEVDLTEASRNMVGLAPLSQGKLFWMNNGASWYNDYTTFRTKSMRTIANEFAGIVPLELFTYASYPHNLTGNMTYNVHNSLLAGHGFWGNLQLMKQEERKWIGSQVKQAKKVLPFLVDVNPMVTGFVGDSPEIYKIVNREEAAGQIILFSEEPFSKEVSVEIDPVNFLVALNHPYLSDNGQVSLSFQSDTKEYSAAVMILPNGKSGISIVSSSSPVVDAECTGSRLEYTVGQPGRQLVYWDKKNGRPQISGGGGAVIDVSEKDNRYEISVDVKKALGRVVLTGPEQ